MLSLQSNYSTLFRKQAMGLHLKRDDYREDAQLAQPEEDEDAIMIKVRGVKRKEELLFLCTLTPFNFVYPCLFSFVDHCHFMLSH